MLIDIVRDTVQRNNLIPRRSRILIALSGGADSVCLLHALLTLKDELEITLFAAHVNHQLRGDEADRDEAFARSLCSQWDVPCFSERFNVRGYAAEKKLSLEEAGREIRYSFFETLLKDHEIDYITTAHHNDDNVETVVMRFLRGSGLHGLSGIPLCNNRRVLRPLLYVSREQIMEYITQNQLPFVTDSTNTEKVYHRNRIRMELIPHMEQFNPNFKKTLCKNIQLYREADAFLQENAAARLQRLAEIRKYDISFSLSELKKEPDVMRHLIIYQALQRISGAQCPDFSRIFDIDRCISARRGSVCGGGVAVYAIYDRLYIVKERALPHHSYALPLNKAVRIDETGAVFTAKQILMANPPKDKKHTIYLNREKAKAFGISIRFRKNGDVFYPAGFGHKKTLQDYFVDKKIPRFMSDFIPLLMVGDEIAWVCGCRADQRFCPGENDDSVIEITYTEDKWDELKH